MKSMICLVIGCCLFTASLAQSANLLKPAPAPPSSSGVSKFGDIPVDLHTGIAAVSIPLTSISVSGLTVPVSINYHGGGVKTEDIASNVGLGWALAAGGQLNKLVVKYPDEGLRTNRVADTIAMIEDGFHNALKRNPLDSFNWKYENDIPDVYRASGPNLNCRFSNLIVHSPKELIKVQRQADLSFLLTNTDGTKYRFGGKANPTTTKAAVEDSSVFYLTEIELVSGQKINFAYEMVKPNFGKSFGRELHYVDRDSTKVNDLVDDGLSEILSPTADTTYRISSITYPGGKVEFVYGAARKDLPGTSVLAGIRQYDLIGSTLMRLTKEINLYQSYFECTSFDVRVNNSVDPRFRSLFYRLRLDSVAINGTAHPDTYAFEYNNAEMPEQGSLSQDHWGYYNGCPNQSLVPPYKMVRQRGTLWEHTVYSSYSNRICNDSLAQAGILKKITYPNGGTASFEYELNTTAVQYPGYVSYPVTADEHQARRQKLFPLTEGLGTTDQNRVFTGCNFVVNAATATGGVKGETVNFLYKKTGNNDVNIQLRITPLAAGTATSAVAIFDTILNMPAGQINPSILYSRFLPNGLYRVTTLKVPYPGGWETPVGTDLLSPAALTFSSGTSIMSQALTSGATGRYAAGGLRIKKMSIFDGNDHSKDIIKTFKYHKFGDTTTSSGSFGQPPEYIEEQATLNVPVLAFQAVVGSTNELYTFSEAFWEIERIYDPGDDSWRERRTLSTQFKQYEIETPAYLAAFDYGPADFNVKMANSNKTAYRPVESYVGYSNVTIEYGNNAAGGKTELTYHNTGADWQRPLLVKEKSYRKNGTAFFPVTEQSNTFTVNADWYYLQSQVSKEFAQDDTTKSLQTKTFYTYTFPYLSTPTRTVLLNSTGDSTVTESTLVAGFSSLTLTDNVTLGIKNLYDKNMLALPVETTSYTKSASGRGNLVSTFTAYATDKPYPETIFTTGTVSSATPFANATKTGGGVVKSSLHQPELKFVKYDLAGNLLEQQKQAGISYAFAWCHNNRYLAAEASNVKNGQFFYTSFEEGNGLFDVNSKAGAQCFNGNYTTTFTPSPAPASPMKIGYWSRTGAIWTYYNKNYTPGMILAGDKIDEVRIYPADAQMVTYTWQPGVGMLSKCDTNNRYLYYEYNAEGKLIAVRNENRDLIQTIQYQPEVN